MNSEGASHYIIRVFCISTNEQCNCCTLNTNKRSEKRNSIEEPNKTFALIHVCMTEKGIASSEPPIYFFGLLSRILNIILESNSKGDIH